MIHSKSTTYLYLILTPPAGERVLGVDIYFPLASLRTLRRQRLTSRFTDLTVSAVLSVTSVSGTRVSNILLMDGSVVFRFDLHPALYSDDGQ